MQLDFKPRVVDGFGNIQLGLGLGYAQAGALLKQPIFSPPANVEKSHRARGTPFGGAAAAAYYLDAMLLEWGIPIVPYAKLGVVLFVRLDPRWRTRLLRGSR